MLAGTLVGTPLLFKVCFVFIALCTLAFLRSSILLEQLVGPLGYLPGPLSNPVPTCRFDLTPLSHLQLSPTIEYSQRHVRAHYDPTVSSLSSAVLESDLQPTFSLVNATDVHPLETCDRPMYLRMPMSTSSRPDASSLLFAMSTTVQGLRDFRGHIRHWMTHSGASLVVMVERDPSAFQLQTEWRAAGIDITIIESKADQQERTASLLTATYSFAKSRRLPTEWIIISDDNTFFPSIPRLLSRLAVYDHRVPFYIGAVSEPTKDLFEIGVFAYGGGGMVFSMPLLEELQPHVGECIELESDGGPDMRIARCVYRYTRTRLTIDWEMHQCDLLGDMDGMYESGFKPLTLHHWHDWAKLPADKVGLISPITGSENLFQRWRSADGRWVLTNGFSIVEFPGGIRPDMSKMEFTWAGEMKQFEQSLGAFREKLQKDTEKVSYRFVHAVHETSAVHQYYAHYDGDKIDRVIELIWLKDGRPYRIHGMN